MFSTSAGSTYPYTLIVEDLFSKYVYIAAMRNIKAGNMAKALHKAINSLPFKVDMIVSLGGWGSNRLNTAKFQFSDRGNESGGNLLL